MQSTEDLKKIASQVRRDIIRMVLYFGVMDQDPATWTREGNGQDTFILSAGHLTPMYYSILSRAGYFPTSELASFRKFGTRLQGHPSIRKGLPGVFQAAGSLGQGLSVAVGMALGKKLAKDNHSVYVLCGDGESEEGQIWEAAMFAAHHKVDNLVAMTDLNGQQIDGTTEDVAGLGDLDAGGHATEEIHRVRLRRVRDRRVSDLDRRDGSGEVLTLDRTVADDHGFFEHFGVLFQDDVETGLVSHGDRLGNVTDGRDFEDCVGGHAQGESAVDIRHRAGGRAPDDDSYADERFAVGVRHLAGNLTRLGECGQRGRQHHGEKNEFLFHWAVVYSWL